MQYNLLTNKNDSNIWSRIDRKGDMLAEIIMLNAEDAQKILQVSQAKVYEVIRSLNVELKEKDFIFYKEKSIMMTKVAMRENVKNKKIYVKEIVL